MARPLKPCGTLAAYRRHLRHGESACDACLAAVAAEKASKRSAARDAGAAVVRLAVAAEPPVLAEQDDKIDPLAEALENLRVIKASMHEAPPQSLAALSKRRQELVALIAELQGKQEVSLADQLAAIRARRTGTAD